MSTVRKVIAVLLAVFLTVPLLFGIIWCTGMTRVALSPELFADLPKTIMEQMPGVVEELFAAARRSDIDIDPDTRAWLKAADQARMRPSEVLVKSGISRWLEEQLSASLKKVGKVLGGEIPPQEVTLDMRPLKQALTSEVFTAYLREVLLALPQCSAEEMQVWQEIYQDQGRRHEWPACRPTPELADQVLAAMQRNIQRDIPDEVQMMEHFDMPPGMSWPHGIIQMSYLLFLIPALFVFLTALIGGGDRVGFFRWSGVLTFIGGVLGWLSSIGVAKLVVWAIHVAPYRYSHYAHSMKQLAFEKTSQLGGLVIKRLFSPVADVSQVVIIVGIVLFALSYLLVEKRPIAPAKAPGPGSAPVVPSAPPAAPAETTEK